MADYRAIEAASHAIVRLLSDSYRFEDFNNDLLFQVYGADDFKQAPIAAGVSVFLYRLVHNGSYRIPTGRLRPDGRREQTRLPLDLHYLLTVWAKDATLQHRIAGWMMRTIEDTPILPHGLVEAVAPGVFKSDESVELVLADLSTEDLFQIWETLVQDGYQLSIPYLARNVRIDSRQTLERAAPVQERVFDERMLQPL